MPVLAPLAALALVLAGETRRETWPDGRPRAEYEVEVRANGREVRSGAYRSWYEDGQLESEGTFADDRETGRWRFYHPGGTRAAEGSFARGERTGPWETFHPDGARASKGRYDQGTRSGAWTFWHADGSEDATSSGSYEGLELRLADGRAFHGELLDGVPHGEWQATWSDGTPLVAGRLARGKREGPWRFHHPDGSPSPLLSGEYVKDVRAGDLAPAAPPSWEPPAAPEASPLGWPDGPRALEDELERWIAADERALAELRRELALRQAQPSWVAAGVRALPVVLRRLLTCDPATAAGREALGRIEARVLRPLCGGHALVALPSGGPATVEAARELQRAWAALWAATRDDAWFWRVELPATPVGVRDELLRERPFRRLLGTLAPPSSPPAPYARRLEPLDKRAQAPLLAALEWLETSQLPDGHWEAYPVKDHPHPGGVTGLALLALLGAGRTPATSAAVTGAVGWFVEQQDLLEGFLPARRRSHAWIYDHAIATLALCELEALFPCAALRPRVQQALDLLFAARNPGGAWRYDLPPTGESDTSVTSWVVAALFAGREAGFEGPFEEAFAGALAFLDEVSDPEVGRVGYSAFGQYSARSEVNEHFPREKGEAMTAAGLFVRRLLGAPVEDALVRKHVELVLEKPPAWDVEGFGIDEYYFYYGAQALALCGALAGSSWEAGLRKLGRTQSGNAAERGSWDPVGAWAYVGGRVYTTAMLALALEAPFRHALPDPAGKAAKKKPRK